MKKTLSIAILAVALLASGCTPYTAPIDSGYLFSHQNFSLYLPAEFVEQSGVINAKDGQSFNQIIISAGQNDVMTQEELLKHEQEMNESLCSDTNACGTIMEVENITINNVKGIKFYKRFEGRSIDDPFGFFNQYQYSFSNGSDHIRFWTIAVDTEDKDVVEKQFDEIINTIEFK